MACFINKAFSSLFKLNELINSSINFKPLPKLSLGDKMSLDYPLKEKKCLEVY
jgi:hypothetical protein